MFCSTRSAPFASFGLQRFTTTTERCGCSTSSCRRGSIAGDAGLFPPSDAYRNGTGAPSCPEDLFLEAAPVVSIPVLHAFAVYYASGGTGHLADSLSVFTVKNKLTTFQYAYQRRKGEVIPKISCSSVQNYISGDLATEFGLSKTRRVKVTPHADAITRA